MSHIFLNVHPCRHAVHTLPSRTQAPEMFPGHPRHNAGHGEAVDVYSFGVVLLELCEGVRPWCYLGVSGGIWQWGWLCRDAGGCV